MSVEKVGLALLITAGVSGALTNAMSTASKNITGLSTKIKDLNKTRVDIDKYNTLAQAGKQGTEQFAKLSKTLKDNNINLTNLTSEADRLDKKLEKLGKTADLKDKFANASASFKSNITDFASFTSKIAGAATVAVLPAFEMDKAKGGLGTLFIDEAGIFDSASVDKIAAKALEVSNKISGLYSTDFVKAAYTMKSSIASLSAEGVSSMMELSAVTAKATLSDIDTITNVFTLGYGVFKKETESVDTFAKRFSNAFAGTVQTFKTNGNDLSTALASLGNNATALEIPMEEQLAVIGTLNTVTGSGAVSATQYKAFIRSIGKAGEELGITVRNSNGKLLSAVEILKNIKKKYGKTLSDGAVQDELGSKLGTAEAVSFINNGIKSVDSLAESQKKLSDIVKNGTLVEHMREVAEQGGEIDLAKQAFNGLAITIGETLKPSYLSILEPMTAFLINGQTFIKDNPNLVNGLLKGATALGELALGYKIFKTVISAARAAQLAFNFALAANPIGLVISALAVGAYMVYTYWDEITAVVSKAFEKLSEVIKAVKKMLGFETNDEIKVTGKGKIALDTITDKYGTSPALAKLKQANEKKANNNTQTNVTYSPKITIQGNADKATIDQAVKTGNDDFAQRVKSTQNSIRLSYGGA